VTKITATKSTNLIYLIARLNPETPTLLEFVKTDWAMCYLGCNLNEMKVAASLELVKENTSVATIVLGIGTQPFNAKTRVRIYLWN